MRDSSPPDATFASGRGAMPLWAETRNSICSSPCAVPSASALNAISKLPPAIASVCIAAVTFSREPLRGLLAARAQLAGGGDVCRVRFLDTLTQRFDVEAAAELSQARARAIERIRQSLRRDPEFARARMHGVETLLDLLEALGINVEPLLVVAQHVHGFLRLRLRRRDDVDDVFEARVVAEQMIQFRRDGA